MKIRTAFRALLEGCIQPVSTEMVIGLIRELGRGAIKADITKLYALWTDAETQDYNRLCAQFQDSTKLRERNYQQLFEGHWDTIKEYVLEFEDESFEEKIRAIDALAEFLESCQNTVGYLEDSQDFYYWDAEFSRYVINTWSVQNLLTEFNRMRLYPLDLSYIKDMMGHLKGINHHKKEEFDLNKDILVFKNGHYSIHDRQLYPADKKYLCLKGFNFDYLRSCVELGTYSKKFFDGLEFSEADLNRLLYVCKAILERTLFQNKLSVIFHGDQDTGKTLLCLKFTRVLGRDNCGMIRIEHLGKSQFSLADAAGKEFVYMDDTSGKALNEDTYCIMKNLVGGGDTPMEKKRENMRMEEITFTLATTTNKLYGLPENENLGNYMSKLLLIHFFKHQQKDDVFKSNFINDLDDNEQFVSFLLNMMPIHITSQYVFTQLPFEEEQYWDIPEEYWHKYQDPIYALIKEFVQMAEGKKVKKDLFLDRLEDYAYARHIPYKRFNKNHSRALREYLNKVGARERKNNNEYWYLGIIGKEMENGVEDDLSPNIYEGSDEKQICQTLYNYDEGLTKQELIQFTQINDELLTPILSTLMTGKDGNIPRVYYDGTRFKLIQT